jgi:O-antigen/teichoic acid export membrane protein
MYISFLITLIFFIAYTLSHLKTARMHWHSAAWKEMFRLGKFAQGGNVLHILNQRLNVVLLENLAMTGRSLAGVYTIAMYGAEVLWTVGKSLSVDQYSRIANSDDRSMQRALTNKYVRYSLSVALAGVLVIVLMPQSFYEWIFQREIPDLRITLLWLAPGILANAVSIILAHFFSGTGNHKYNFIASGLGLLSGSICGVLFIPDYGLKAAAGAASVAFVVQLLFFLLIYFRLRKNEK